MANLIGKQSGTVTIASGTSSITATPSSYDPTQSILFVTQRGGDSTATDGLCRREKTSSTVLTFTRVGTGSDTIIIDWELEEYDSDISVQDVISTGGPQTSDDVTITAVTLARTFIVDGNLSALGTQIDANEYFLWKLTTTTNARLERNTTGSGSAPIQVVDFIGCSVEEVNDVATSFSTADRNTTIGSVTIANTLVLCTHKTDNTGENFSDNIFRTRLTTTTNVQATRAGTSSNDITWDYFIVEFTDGTTIQDGLHTVANADDQDDITVTEVVLAETTAIFGSSGWGQTHGSSDNADDDPRDGFFTADLTTTTNLQVTRVTSSGACLLNYQLIEWNVAGFFNRRYYDEFLGAA